MNWRAVIGSRRRHGGVLGSIPASMSLTCSRQYFSRSPKQNVVARQP
jgi:hypothetical protein